MTVEIRGSRAKPVAAMMRRVTDNSMICIGEVMA